MIKRLNIVLNYMSNQNLIKVFEKLIIDKQNEINDLKKDKEKNSTEIKQLTFKVINFRKAIYQVPLYI